MEPPRQPPSHPTLLSTRLLPALSPPSPSLFILLSLWLHPRQLGLKDIRPWLDREHQLGRSLSRRGDKLAEGIPLTSTVAITTTTATTTTTNTTIHTTATNPARRRSSRRRRRRQQTPLHKRRARARRSPRRRPASTTTSSSSIQDRRWGARHRGR